MLRSTAVAATAAAARTRAFAVAAAVWLLAALALALPLAAAAQDGADPPTRAARLAEATGRVWLFAADANEWLEIGRNRPLAAGDRLATDDDAYAEIALGTTVLRLAPATELEIAVLDDRSLTVHLHGGSVAARLKTQEAAGGFALATDEGRFVARTAGSYRFDRFERTSDVTVLAGQATFENRANALAVNAGQHAQFWLDGRGAPQYAMVDVARDAFAGWADERDRAEARLASAPASRYVSPEMVGAEDLDRYGRWEDTGEYGAVWTPRAVPVDWAPYSHGHWAWVSPWGWTWVDDAPWGYAPFHYGRWVWYRERWGWAPGRYVQRPVYAPALVAWLGGPGISVGVTVGGGRGGYGGFGGPAVGWVPLAPREVYVPPFRTSAIYVRNLNAPYVADVNLVGRIVDDRRRGDDRRDFANRKFPHAVTVVPTSVLERRERVDPIAARFRNDPIVRDFVRDTRPVEALVAPPIDRPRVAPLPRDVRAGIRPPFEGRAPGFLGRPDAPRGADRNGDGRIDRADRGDRGAERPGRVDAGPDRTERDRVDRGDRPVGGDRGDRFDRGDRGDRGDRMGIPRGFPRSDDPRVAPAVRGDDPRAGDPRGRPDRPDRPDRFDRADRTVGTPAGEAAVPPPPRAGGFDGRGVAPPTRIGPPDTRVGAPETRVGPPDGGRFGPPETRVGPPATRVGPPETRGQPGDGPRGGGRFGSPDGNRDGGRFGGAPDGVRGGPPARMDAPAPMPAPAPRMEAPRPMPQPQVQAPPPVAPVQAQRPPEVQRPASPPPPRDAGGPPRNEERRGGGRPGGERERER